MGFLTQLGVSGLLNLLSTMGPMIEALINVVHSANPATPATDPSKVDAIMTGVMGAIAKAPALIAAVQATGKDISDAVHTGDISTLTSHVASAVNAGVAMADAAGAFQKSTFVQAVTAEMAKQPSDPASA